MVTNDKQKAGRGLKGEVLKRGICDIGDNNESCSRNKLMYCISPTAVQKQSTQSVAHDVRGHARVQ